MLERDIVIAIKIYLASLGSDIFFWKEHGGMYGRAGIPDIIACIDGKFYGFEVKTEIGRPTKLQNSTIAKIRNAGGIAQVVRSVEDVKVVIADG